MIQPAFLYNTDFILLLFLRGLVARDKCCWRVQ